MKHILECTCIPGAQPGGEAFGAFAPLKISKHYLATLTFAKLSKIKMKFCILIIFSKVLLEFFFLVLVNYLFTSLI